MCPGDRGAQVSTEGVYSVVIKMYGIAATVKTAEIGSPLHTYWSTRCGISMLLLGFGQKMTRDPQDVV
jgi:hypothetical protein